MTKQNYKRKKKSSWTGKKKVVVEKRIPTPPPVALPGTKKIRRRALNVLKAEKLNKNSWRVWGGKADHIVTYGNGSITCDCWVNKDGGVCSHIIKVLYETKVMPKG